MEGRRIIIPFLLQKQILEQLHSNHMDNNKIELLARVSVYWVNMNADIKNTETVCYMLGIPANTTTRGHAGLGKQLVLIYFLLRSTHLCTVGYYSKFPIIKKLTASQLMT